MKALILAAALAALSIPAHAQTARRVWLLCAQEDPQCGPLLEQALDALEANPNWDGHQCHPKPPIDMDRLYIDFMRTMDPRRMSFYSESSARIGMYITLNMAGLCQ